MGGKRTDEKTIQAIIDLHKAGISNKEICIQKGLKLRTVQELIQKFKAGGSKNLPLPRKASGRPRKVSERTRTLLRRQLEVNPSLTGRQIKEGNPNLFAGVSLRTVHDALRRDLGYRSYRAKKKPLINDSQRKKRIQFARKYQDWTLEKWRTVLWSDESTFCVSGTTSNRVYRRPGSDPNDPRYTQKTTKHPQSLMVWGCFTFSGLGDLVVFPKNTTITKEVYLELLMDHLELSFEKTKAEIFQQDGAPAHTAKIVKEWLDNCEINTIKDWPGNSPDISPIENLWAVIKAKLRDRDTSTLPKLEKELRTCWADFKPETLQNLADSIPKRLKEMLKKKGNAIKY